MAWKVDVFILEYAYWSLLDVNKKLPAPSGRGAN